MDDRSSGSSTRGSSDDTGPTGCEVEGWLVLRTFDSDLPSDFATAVEYRGAIDEVRYYDRALTPEEVAGHASQ